MSLKYLDTADNDASPSQREEQDVAKRFRKRCLANEDLLEILFSGAHIGVEDGCKRKRGASNIDNQSDLSKAFRERSDAIKLAAAEMSSALTSDVTMAARRMHQISEIEFGSTFYWDANKLLSNDEVARRWFLGIPENKFALLYLRTRSTTILE
ncbi:hypothetical protein ARALYDRAFT_326729 [Arabidopsis lyrata subsp. lyrata]|uniref:Uncharacterized protein n=1 Tax=Arabidopsis lyrata subsp. lyrata TaxID=81972 RepID=D7M340_ARALL|nr:hypothetical protein ARALYDRAFT_326729 [Arabidopsis lyrata subsp. lyrata]